MKIHFGKTSKIFSLARWERKAILSRWVIIQSNANGMGQYRPFPGYNGGSFTDINRDCKLTGRHAILLLRRFLGLPFSRANIAASKAPLFLALFTFPPPLFFITPCSYDIEKEENYAKVLQWIIVQVLSGTD